MTHEEAVKVICQARGTHFDPEVVDAFEAAQDEFRAVAARFRDAGGKPPRSLER